MSQSPTDSQSFDSLTRYRQGWKALNRLLHEERSFSGNEKNCAFLSLKNGKFAAVSSVSGLDFNDDSRALATCDWDFDGRVDLWTSARTAPRVRFLRNQNSNQSHFVAVQLQGNGTTTNRDAIGARVEIVTNADELSALTLHAGDGFLTQSSRWMHFGLGDASAIKQVRVRWPGGKTESFGPVELDGFYLLRQGTSASAGTVTTFNRPGKRPSLVASPQSLPASSQTARIVPPYRLPLPAINYTAAKATEQSTKHDRSLRIETPTVVCFWSATCPNCVRELSEWSKAKSEFDKNGVNVVALCTDLGATPEQIAQREKFLASIEFPFQHGVAKEKSLQQVDLFQRALMDLWQTMPVPCSFLLDRLGRVVAIYKGPVELDQIWRDLELVDADADQIRAAALPFAGRWGTSAPQADPLRISSQMIDHTHLDGAISYLQQFLQTAKRAGNEVSPTQMADVQFMQSVLLDSKGEKAAALKALEASRDLNPRDHRIRVELAEAYLKRRNAPLAESELRAAIQINAKDFKSRRNLGIVLLQRNQLPQAIEQFQVLLSQRPRDELAHFHMGTALRRSGKWKEASTAYQHAIDLKPSFHLAANNLAWILATHPDASLRNGKQAVRIAERMCQQTKFSQPTFLDTLAAAYAEAGAFDKANQTIERLISAFKSAGKPVSKSILERRALYAKEKPFRESV